MYICIYTYIYISYKQPGKDENIAFQQPRRVGNMGTSSLEETNRQGWLPERRS